MPHGEGDRLPIEHSLGHIMKHAISHIDGIGKPEQPAWCVMFFRKILEDPLPSDAGVCILALRRRQDILGRTLMANIHERIDASSGESNDATGREMTGDQCRDMAVHRPCQRFIPARAELHARHEDHILCYLQLPHGRFVEQVAGNGFNACILKVLTNRFVRKAGHADYFAIRVHPLRHPRQRRSHLAADTEDRDCPGSFGKIFCQPGNRPGHEVLKLCHIFKSLRHNCHGFVSNIVKLQSSSGIPSSRSG